MIYLWPVSLKQYFQLFLVPEELSLLSIRSGCAGGSCPLQHCTALRGEEVQLQSLQQLSPALQPGLTAALHCEICSSSLYSSMSFQMLVWGWDRGSAGASRLVLAPIHQPARPSAILTRWRRGLFSRPGLETGDMQGKDVDNVDLGHKLQLDLYS